MPAMTPDNPAVRDWIARCEARPAAAKMATLDGAI